jgi:O-methyltransferase
MEIRNINIYKTLKSKIKSILINNYPVKNLILNEKSQLDYDFFLIYQFINYGGGEEYGINTSIRKNLVEKFKRTINNVESATSLYIHLYLAQRIFRVNSKIEGVIVECGSFNGASTANLSLACKLVNRKLIVCDSFEGLPDDNLKLHVGMHSETFGYYKKGMFNGTLEAVKENIEKFGDIQSCVFLKGFYYESLVNLKDPIIMAFLDVDLVSSTQDCLKYIRPLLIENGEVITDDSLDLEVVKVFFDDGWWRSNFKTISPGYVGSGSGLLPCYPSLGYSRKIDFKKLNKMPHLFYPE